MSDSGSRPGASRAAASAASPPRPATFGAAELGLYAITVFAWSTSWIALRFQLGHVAPEVSLLWRFLLSGLLMWIWVSAARLPWRFPLRVHLKFMALGLFLFSLNFTLMYYAGSRLPSGLLSVVFALSSVFNLLLGRVFLKAAISPRIALGGLIGVIGVGLMFWPQVAGAQFNGDALIGLALAAGGTLSFSCGNIVSARMQTDRVPVMTANAWGMIYGALLLVLVSLVRGHDFVIDLTVNYLGSLVYLASISSGIAFWAYLTLLGRIGSGRAGYATVMFPVFALLISTVFEHYHWTAPSLLGLGLALVGNLIVLKSGRPA